MDWIQRFIWAAAATGIAIALLGFLVVEPSAQVPTKFGLGGWTTTHERNVSLPIFIGSQLLVAGTLSITLSGTFVPWLRWLAIAIMTLLPITTLLAVLEAA
jgi:hypothetical protein